MCVFRNLTANFLILSLFSLFSITNTAPPENETINEYNLLKLKSFWKGVGSSIAYPGKILLTSDKLKEQRGVITTYEPTDLSDYFSMIIHVNFHITNKESQQSMLISLTNSNVSPAQFKEKFGLLPLTDIFSGLIVYIKNFDTMHVGTFDSKNFNEDELLSRSKVCKISQKENGFFSFQIEYKVGKISILLMENQDGSFRPCAQFSNFKFNGPVFITSAAADDYGFSETVICKHYIFYNQSSLGYENS